MSIIKRKAGSEDIVKSILEFDEVPTEGSHNLVESGAVAVVAKQVEEIGKPLQWKGPATVAQLNTGITGIQPGWTYTLTDAGTLTDGSVVVDAGDEVAWTGTAWFKLGHNSTTEDIQKMIDDAVYSSEIAILSNITPAANTLRFAFSKKDYDPTVAGVGSSGTWTKLATTQANVWDWTRSGTTFTISFQNAFMDNNNLVSVIAAGDTSEKTVTYYMFSGCTSLTSVVIFDTSNVDNMRAMFNGCTSLKSVPLFNTSSSTTTRDMFNGCTSLKSIPLLNTSRVTDSNSMFNGCTKVEGGTLALYQRASTQTTPPTNHTDMFKNCGIDTEIGTAELAQIPQSWGGTMPNP